MTAWGERLDTVISIHALREESDASPPTKPTLMLYFNPRPPRGERRITVVLQESFVIISIHALREESDAALLLLTTAAHYFNPRPPRGERPDLGADVDNAQKFQSTPSARRATLQAL